MMEKGYVKIYRKLLDSGLIQHGPAVQLFLYLLLRANHKTSKAIVNGIPVILNPGDVIFGRAKASSELKLTEQTTRTALKLLEKMEIVTSRPTSRYTVISIVKWDVYQSNQPTTNQPTNQQLTSGQPAANQPLTTSKECKNVRIKELNTPPTPSRGKGGVKFIPPTPDDVDAYCQERNNGISGQAFCDFYEARGWVVGKTKMKDWKAAVRTWESRRKEQPPPVQVQLVLQERKPVAYTQAQKQAQDRDEMAKMVLARREEQKREEARQGSNVGGHHGPAIAALPPGSV